MRLISGDPGDGWTGFFITNSSDNGPETNYVRFSRRQGLTETNAKDLLER